MHDSQDILYTNQLPSADETPMLIMDYLFYSQHNVHPPYADTAYPVFDLIGKMREPTASLAGLASLAGWTSLGKCVSQRRH